MADSNAERQRRYRDRQKAIEHGRLLGADEADRRLETGQRREERITRAALYAQKLYDGEIG